MYWFLVNWKEIFGGIANVMKISSLGFHLSETFYVRMRGKRSWITKKSAPFLIWAEYVQVQAIKYGKSLIPHKSMHSTEKLENPVGKNKHIRMFWLFFTWPSHLRPIYHFGRFSNRFLILLEQHINDTLGWVFTCKFAAYFQNTFS